MKFLSKILKPVLIVITGLSAVMFIAAMIVQDKVATIVLQSLSNDISTKFEIGSVKLSFIKRFPRATLDLRNVLVHSSPGFERKCFDINDTDTLLAARSVIMEFRIRDIVKGSYNIDRIGVKNGILKILTDTAGMVNYEIRSENMAGSNNQLALNLEGIHVTNVEAFYNNRATELIIAGIMENGRLKSRISGNEIDFTAKGDVKINIFTLYNLKISNSINTGVDVKLNSSKDGVRFDKSTLLFDKNTFGIEGFISSDNLLNLSVTGENVNISGIKNHLPAELLKKVNEYDPEGILTVEAKIIGIATRKSNPAIQITYSLNDGSVKYNKSPLLLQNISFTGSFTNGPKMIPQTYSLKLDKFSAKLGSSLYTGSLAISDFTSPSVNLGFSGVLIPSEITQFFNLKGFSSPSGSVEFDLRTSGNIPLKKKYTISDFLSLENKARLNFKSFGISLNKSRIRINNATGTIIAEDRVSARDLVFNYNEQHIRLSGTFVKLTEWLSGKNVTLTASASVAADRIVTSTFLPDKQKVENGKSAEKSFSLPPDVILDLDVNIGNLIHKSFNATNVTGKLQYKPRTLNFKNLKLNSLDGLISGDGFFSQNADKTSILRGTFTLKDINVKSTFFVFNNFGQNFIKDENLEGILSGSIAILIPMDQMFRSSARTLTAEGKFILEKGELVNFEPVKELSEFIDISELENIRFEELANDFFIRNNSLNIPQMDVRSSAADLSINGRHGFDNHYEYHVKILLSEILSKKIPKPRPNTTEFGAVKDDGLGRTSLLLKIEDRGDEVKISYDVKAAGTQVKNEIKKERESLKTILNEEYGWFRGDSTVVSKTAASRERRFKVIWEENDSTKVSTEETPAEKRIIRNPFKKRQ